MSTYDYIPQADAHFASWVRSFRDGVASDPTRYMLVQADINAISDVVDTFLAKFTTANGERTRTTPTINEKDAARYTCEHLIRAYAIQIKHNLGIDDSDKLRIGVRPLRTRRGRIGAPMNAPLLDVVHIAQGLHVLRFADSSTPNSKAKPYGIQSLHLHRGFNDAHEPVPIGECSFLSQYGRNYVRVPYAQEDDGKVAVYYGRWATQGGLFGPWSLPIMLRITGPGAAKDTKEAKEGSKKAA